MELSTRRHPHQHILERRCLGLRVQRARHQYVRFGIIHQRVSGFDFIKRTHPNSAHDSRLVRHRHLSVRSQFLPRDIYLISALPSDLRWPDVGTIGMVAVVLAFLATLYPSWRAARVRPAEALRYE